MSFKEHPRFWDLIENIQVQTNERMCACAHASVCLCLCMRVYVRACLYVCAHVCTDTVGF